MHTIRNRVQLIGKLGVAPEVKSFENGKKLAKFRMATNEIYQNNKGEKVEDTQWHEVVAWGGLAEIVEKYLDKGSDVVVEGRLVHDSYEDKDGVKRYKTEITANEVVMLGGKKS